MIGKNNDNILRVEIDNSGRLHLTPEVLKFNLIYRTATEVNWDNDKETLYSPKPRDWSYLEWFLHITSVVKSECSTDLELTEKTEWVDIPDELKKEMKTAQQSV